MPFRARGLDSLTIRPLSRGLPPDEEWVILGYRDADGELHEYRQDWLLFEPGVSAHSVNPRDSGDKLPYARLVDGRLDRGDWALVVAARVVGEVRSAEGG